METAENYVDACFRLNQTLFMHGCARKQQAIMSSGKRDVEDYSRSMSGLDEKRQHSSAQVKIFLQTIWTSGTLGQ